MIKKAGFENSSRTVKLTFRLSEEQAGPFPVSTESLWCIKEEGNYRIKNIPFFIDGISFDDLISIIHLSDDLVEIDEVIQASGNSTIWLYVKDELHGAEALNAIKLLGCGVEGGVLEGYFSLNVPSHVDIKEVNAIIEKAESHGFVISDNPSIRHDANQ